MKPVVFAFFISLIITFDGASAARILGIFPFPGKSHFIMFERLMKGLADKGHEVDMLSPFPQKESLPRFKDLSVEGVFPNITNNVTMDDLNALSFHALVKSIFEEGGTDLCEAVFNSSAGQQLMKTKVKYDLIITEIFGTDCFLGYAHLFQVPVIAMVTSFPYPWVSERFGLPDNPSYIMNYFFPYVGQFSLLQRVKNVFMSIYAKLGYHYYSTLACNVVARKYFGPDLPDLATLANNMSLLLVNSHHSWYQARPLPPNVKEVAGLHIKLPKSTEGELGEFLNKSSNGVIYFSMGSMVDVGCIIIALVLFVLSIIYLVMTIVLKFNCIFKSQKKKKEKTS